jgi:flavodoxin
MKALIIFYSRTGHTRKVAEDICSLLYGTKEKLEDLKNRDGLFGWLSAGRDAVLEKETKIEETIKDPSKFDIVILGTPVWAGKMCPAIRTYISKNKKDFKKVAFFCTSGGSNFKRAVKNMESVCGKSPVCVCNATSHDVKHENYLEKVKDFCDNIELIVGKVPVNIVRAVKEENKKSKIKSKKVKKKVSVKKNKTKKKKSKLKK